MDRLAVAGLSILLGTPAIAGHAPIDSPLYSGLPILFMEDIYNLKYYGN